MYKCECFVLIALFIDSNIKECVYLRYLLYAISILFGGLFGGFLRWLFNDRADRAG